MPTNKSLSRISFDPSFYRRFQRYYTYIEPVILDPAVQNYLEIFASLVLIALLVLFALSPTVSTILGLVKKIDDQKRVDAALDAKIKTLITAQGSYSQAEDSLPLLSIVLPQKPAPEMVVTETIEEASASAVSLDNLQIGPMFLSGAELPSDKGTAKTPPKDPRLTAINTKIPSLTFSLSVSGQTANINRFLLRLEKDEKRLMRISSLTISRGDSGSLKTSGDLKVAISGNAYYLMN